MTQTVSIRSVAVAIGILALAGCGGSVSEGKPISGLVTFKDQPLVCGTVTLFYPDNTVLDGSISPDGTYVIPSGKPGKPKITVVSEKPSPAGTNPGGRGPAVAAPVADPAKWVAIPAKYAKLETTPLELTVASTLNIKLEP